MVSFKKHIFFQFSYYPAYHTQYDTFNYVKQHVDPEFQYHRIMGQIFIQMINQLSDSYLLPLDAGSYGDTMATMMGLFQKVVMYLSKLAWFTYPQGQRFYSKYPKCCPTMWYTYNFI